MCCSLPFIRTKPCKCPAGSSQRGGAGSSTALHQHYISCKQRAQRWACGGLRGFSFRDCLPGLSGKMTFLSDVLAPRTKPARGMQPSWSDTLNGLTLSLLDFSTTSRSLKFMTYFLLRWASLCFSPLAWKLEVAVVCSYVKNPRLTFLSPLHLFQPSKAVVFNKAIWTGLGVPSRPCTPMCHWLPQLWSVPN